MKGQTVTAAFEPCQASSGYDSTWWKSQTRQIHWLVKKLPRLCAGWHQIPIHLKSLDMIEDCQETRDATLLGTPFVISLCPRGQFHHVVMQAIWNHGKSWCWRSKDSCGQGLTGVRKEMHKLKRREWCYQVSRNLLFQVLDIILLWTLYLELPISILHFACPTKILWWCQPCKDAWVHYSFAEPGRQECWWKWTTFWKFCHLRYIFCCFISTSNIFGWFPIGIRCRSRILRLTQHDQASGWGEFYLTRTFWMQRFPTKRNSPDRWLWLSPAWTASSYTSVPQRMGPTGETVDL